MDNLSSRKKFDDILSNEGFIVANADVLNKMIESYVISPIKKHEVPQEKSVDAIQLEEKIQIKPKKAEQQPKVIELKKIKEKERGLNQEIKNVITYLNWHMKRISNHIIGRNDIIEQIFYAIITGEHMLLLSRTGMAKSYLTNYIFDSFEDVRIFSSQASKDQTPDNYFGPYNIDEFKKGHIRHNLHGSVIEANLVFLDEFFDANDVVLRSLLTVLNERKFINGQEQIDAAVHSAIATANYMRLNEVTEAILDRFMYKAIIPPDNNSYNKFLIDQKYITDCGKIVEPSRRTPFNKVMFLHSIIKNQNPNHKINIPYHLSYLKNIIIDKYAGEMSKHDSNYFISPRKQAKMLDFLRASALLNGRMEVALDDLKKLYLPICTLNSIMSVNNKNKTEKDIFLDTFERELTHFSNTGALEQLELLLNIRHLFQEIADNPEKIYLIEKSGSIVNNLFNLVKKLFPGEVKEDKLTIQKLHKAVMDLKPAVQEIQELRDGILSDYHGIINYCS